MDKTTARSSDNDVANLALVLDEALRLLKQRDSEHNEEKMRIDALLIDGLDSGPSTPMTSHDWDEIEREGQRFIATRSAGRPGGLT